MERRRSSGHVGPTERTAASCSEALECWYAYSLFGSSLCKFGNTPLPPKQTRNNSYLAAQTRMYNAEVLLQAQAEILMYADIVCLQETKFNRTDMKDIQDFTNVPGWYSCRALQLTL